MNHDTREVGRRRVYNRSVAVGLDGFEVVGEKIFLLGADPQRDLVLVRALQESS